MPVHIPGPKLYSSIPFKHLAQGGEHGTKKASDVHLNITPFVDMMTILVTFLLMTFSASGEVLMSQKGLELPDATNKDALRRAPVMIVSRTAITFNNEDLGISPESVANQPAWKIPELQARLKQEREKYKRDQSSDEKQRCINPDPKAEPDKMCLDGLAIMQSDKRITAKVLNRVLKTANAAGYKNIMFAVNRKSPRSATE